MKNRERISAVADRAGWMRSAGVVLGQNAVESLHAARPTLSLIAMINAMPGISAPIRATDSWPVYTDDQLRCWITLGSSAFMWRPCVLGGSYCLALIQAAPQRVASAVFV